MRAARYLITTAYKIPDSSSGSTKLRSAPFGFEYGGYYHYDGGSLGGENVNGDYWSRSTISVSNAYILDFGSNGVGPQRQAYRGMGQAVRCVARWKN